MTDRAAVVRRALFRLAPIAGLALAACGTPQGERPIEARFEKAWARADVKIGSTRFCRRGV